MAAQARPLAGPARVSLRSRFYGFGSIYGKTVRDSRLTFIIAAGLLGGMALVMGAGIGTVFPTAASRLEIDKLIGSMPASMVNLFGKPDKLGTLGGYMSWKYGSVFAMGTALWSILALSGTLAGEASKGNLDIVASTPFGKHRIALEKLAAHLTVLGLSMAVLAIMTVVSSNAFGDAAMGDHIAPLSSIGFALWVGFIALFFGGLAFALAPFLGRSGSAGVAAAVMVLLWVANGFTALAPLATISPFHWTVNHVALVGEFDWPGLALVGLVAVAFMASRCSPGATWVLRPGCPCRRCQPRRWASTAPRAGRSATSCPGHCPGGSAWASWARSLPRSSGASPSRSARIRAWCPPSAPSSRART
jgi:putative exporter of polyketide antibiotics